MESIRRRKHMLKIKRKIYGRLYTAEVSEKDFVSPKEASIIMCVGLRHVYRLMDDSKKLEYKRFGKRRVLLCKDIIDYMKIRKKVI